MMLAVMYGMMPEREDRQLQQRTAGEQVDQGVEGVALGLVDALLNVA